MATSSEWAQLWDPIPLFEQERRHDSLPVQPTSSSQIVPEPDPNLQRKWYWIKAYFDDLYNMQTYFWCDNNICCLSFLCTMTFQALVTLMYYNWGRVGEWTVYKAPSMTLPPTFTCKVHLCVILIPQWWCWYFCIYNRLASDSYVVKMVVVMSTLTFQFLL